MSKDKLLGPDGKPIKRSLSIEYAGKRYPYRVVDQDVLAATKVDPITGFMGCLVQMGDMNNLTWLAMLALAKDIYSRQPDGSRYFEDLVKEINMNIIDMERSSTSIADELKKILG